MRKSFALFFVENFVYNMRMVLEDIKIGVMKKLEGAPMIGAHIKIDLEGLGAFIIDGTVQPPVFVTDETTHIDTTLICAPETLNSILSGTQDPTLAYMMGKLKVQGSMGYALKLNSFLSD